MEKNFYMFGTLPYRMLGQQYDLGKLTLVQRTPVILVEIPVDDHVCRTVLLTASCRNNSLHQSTACLTALTIEFDVSEVNLCVIHKCIY